MERPIVNPSNLSLNPKTDPESPVLDLLSVLEAELTHSLNSLGGKTPKVIGDRYFVEAASYIHRAVDGYLVLRKKGRIDSSKLLVRSAIEAMIRIQALRAKPEIFYQIAYSERIEDHKWFRPAATKAGIVYDKDPDPPGWSEFESAFRREFPAVALNTNKLSLRDAAVAAGLEKYYDTHYRLYCQYAHAALRAMGGHSDDLSDPEDSRTMVLCAFVALSAIVPLGAESPSFDSLHVRVDELSKSPPLPLASSPKSAAVPS